MNPNAMTAAHKTLPLGSVVRVVNQRTGKSITVTINDRGPYIKGRIIDLSKAAGRQLGIIPAGTGTCVHRPGLIQIHRSRQRGAVPAVAAPFSFALKGSRAGASASSASGVAGGGSPASRGSPAPRASSGKVGVRSEAPDGGFDVPERHAEELAARPPRVHPLLGEGDVQ